MQETNYHCLLGYDEYLAMDAYHNLRSEFLITSYYYQATEFDLKHAEINSGIFEPISNEIFQNMVLAIKNKDREDFDRNVNLAIFKWENKLDEFVKCLNSRFYQNYHNTYLDSEEDELDDFDCCDVLISVFRERFIDYIKATCNEYWGSKI